MAKTRVTTKTNKPKTKAKSKPKPKTKPKTKAKPKTKTKSKAKAKPKTKAKPLPTAAQLAPLAMAQDVDGLLALIMPERPDDSGEADELLYKWLEVASDFGSEAADDLMVDLLEASSLRYDDDQIATGGAHWELGVAYLTATEHLPRDLEKAAAQLAMAKERWWPWTIQGATKLIATTRKGLDPEARTVFDRIYDGTKPTAAESNDDEA